jgi:hypothetical protein
MPSKATEKVQKLVGSLVAAGDYEGLKQLAQYAVLLEMKYSSMLNREFAPQAAADTSYILQAIHDFNQAH